MVCTAESHFSSPREWSKQRKASVKRGLHWFCSLGISHDFSSNTSLLLLFPGLEEKVQMRLQPVSCSLFFPCQLHSTVRGVLPAWMWTPLPTGTSFPGYRCTHQRCDTPLGGQTQRRSCPGPGSGLSAI